MEIVKDFFKQRTEDLSFITLKADAQLKLEGYCLPEEGLTVPLLTEELAENIKTRQGEEVLTLGAILRGMAYTLGVDRDFIYRAEYEKLMRSADQHIERFLLDQGVKYADQGKLLESIIYFRSVLTLNPEHAAGLLHYGVSLLKYCVETHDGKRAEVKALKNEAKQSLEQLLSYEENPQAYYHLAYIYQEEKQFVKAQLYLEKLVAQEGDELMKLQAVHMLQQLEDLANYERGYNAVLAHRPEEGLKYLLPLEEKFEEWWNLLFFIALAHRQLGKYVEALSYFQRVLALKPDQVDALVEVSLCFGSLGDYQEAITYGEKALELGGANGEILSNLAVIYMEMGLLDDAEACLKESLAIDPQDEITLACAEQLKRLRQQSI